MSELEDRTRQLEDLHRQIGEITDQELRKELIDVSVEQRRTTIKRLTDDLDRMVKEKSQLIEQVKMEIVLIEMNSNEHHFKRCKGYLEEVSKHFYKMKDEHVYRLIIPFHFVIKKELNRRSFDFPMLRYFVLEMNPVRNTLSVRNNSSYTFGPGTLAQLKENCFPSMHDYVSVPTDLEMKTRIDLFRCVLQALSSVESSFDTQNRTHTEAVISNSARQTFGEFMEEKKRMIETSRRFNI